MSSRIIRKETKRAQPIGWHWELWLEKNKTAATVQEQTVGHRPTISRELSCGGECWGENYIINLAFYFTFNSDL